MCWQKESRHFLTTDSLKNAVLQKLYFKHDVTKEVESEYKEFYPDEIKFRNQGGLYLIAKDFFSWAMDLLEFITNGYSQQQFMKNSNDYIAMNLERLRNDESILNQFRQTLAALGVAVDVNIVEAIHLRIAEYVFRAYSKKRNNEEFNPFRQLKSDASNLSFRTQIQTRTKGESSNSKMPAAPKAKVLRREMLYQHRYNPKYCLQRTKERH